MAEKTDLLTLKRYALTKCVLPYSTSHHDVDVSHCSGKEGLSSLIAVKGTCKTLRLHACRETSLMMPSTFIPSGFSRISQLVSIVHALRLLNRLKVCNY